MNIETEIKKLREEIKTISNQFSAMNKYYAEAMTKTLITKEDLKLVLEHIKSIKEVDNGKGKNTRRNATRTRKNKNV